MELFTVGKQYPEMKRMEDCVSFDLANGCIPINIGLISPSADTMKSFLQNTDFNMAYIKINSVIFILLKFKNLDWMAIPYNVHLSEYSGGKRYPKDGEGLAIKIQVFDTTTGTLCQIVISALPIEESAELIKMIKEQEKEPFNHFKFNLDIMKTRLFHSVEDLVRLAEAEPNE